MIIKTLSTSEIDDIDTAVTEITRQAGGFSPKNTFGILSCHFEFVISGAAAAIVRSLPFPVCGATTSLSGSNAADGALMLSITVVSGDEIEKTEIITTPPVNEDTDIDKTLSRIFRKDAEKAALVWVFAPDFMVVNGDILCSAYNKTGYESPLFGTYAVDDSPLFNEECFVLSPDGFSRDSIVFMKIFGDIDPKIGVCSIPREKILPREGVITDVVPCGVKTIDGEPASVFLQVFGIAKQLEMSGAISALSIISNAAGESEYYSRTLLGVNPDGSALTGGDLRTGDAIRIGLFDRDGMIEAARGKLTEIIKGKEVHALFIYCCATRSVALGFQSLDEITLAREIAGDIPFTLSYAGGEIAPLQNGNAFFHNQSFCICAI